MGNFKSIYDVESTIISKRIEGCWESICRIDVYHDGVFVHCKRNESERALESLKLMLSDSITYTNVHDVKISVLHKKIPIYIEEDEDCLATAPYELRPLLRDTALLTTNSSREAIDAHFCNITETHSKPRITAFFSFKGGVGRTLHLTAVTHRLIEATNSSMSAPKVLLIDADTEAPGITWWTQKILPQPDYSYLDLLADAQEGADYAAENASSLMRGQRLEFGGPQQVCFFLPAFRDTVQMLRPPMSPEQLTLGGDSPWLLTDTLLTLGRKLDIDHIVIDLRAGMTELSSPLFLDPRIKRILVTTTSHQSVQGTAITLNELVKFAKMAPESICNSYADNTQVLIGFVPPSESTGTHTLPITEQLEKTLLQLPRDSSDDESDFSTIAPLDWFAQSDYDQSLLGLGDFHDALQYLKKSQTVQAACDTLLPATNENSDIQKSTGNESTKTNDLHRLRDFTANLIAAEQQGTTPSFLVTAAYRQLAKSFLNRPPSAVILGAKGSGKTFFLKALAHCSSWKSFCEKCNLPDAADTKLIPLFWSKNESESGNEKLLELQTSALRPINPDWDKNAAASLSRYLEDSLATPTIKDRPHWRSVWLQTLCQAFGCEGDNPLSTEERLKKSLAAIESPITLLIDGLEDLFASWMSRAEIEFEPLRMLLQDIVRDISSWSNGKVGILVFIRKDLAFKAISQNFEQFMTLYKNFELRWSREEALRLIGWVLGESDLKQYRSNLSDDDWNNRVIDHMPPPLIPLWGLKLGGPESREAYTATWVLSVLSDFKGNIQARDVIRFLHESAKLQSQTGQMPTDRLLAPPALRSAPQYCGQQKIIEVFKEISILEGQLKQLKESNLRIPATEDELRSNGVTNFSLLEEFGILLRDADKYYLPEIYRQGLGLALNSGARPKVVNLMRKAWEKAGI